MHGLEKATSGHMTRVTPVLGHSENLGPLVRSTVVERLLIIVEKATGHTEESVAPIDLTMCCKGLAQVERSVTRGCS